MKHFSIIRWKIKIYTNNFEVNIKSKLPFSYNLPNVTVSTFCISIINLIMLALFYKVQEKYLILLAQHLFTSEQVKYKLKYKNHKNIFKYFKNNNN